MRKFNAIILVLLIFGSRHCQAWNQCPRGKFYHVSVDNNHKCPANAIILNADGKYNCCEDITPCRSGSIAHFCTGDYCKRYYTPVYERSMDKLDEDVRPFVHPIDEGGGNMFLCPKPIALLYLKQFTKYSGDFPKKYLPVDFKDMNTYLRECQKHGDCKEDQFCGNVVNHSYEPDIAGRCSQQSTLSKICGRDQDCPNNDCWMNKERWTYTDKKHKYCYPLPTIPDQYIDQMKFAMVRTVADLTVCRTNANCFTEDNDGEFCVHDIIKNVEWSMYVPDKKAPSATGWRETMPGLCMNSKPFAFIYRDFFMDHDGMGGIAQSDTEPDLALPYLPSGYNHRKPRFAENYVSNCKLNKDCGQGKFCDYRHSLVLEKGHRESNRQYCYAVPKLRSQAHPNARHLIDPNKISLFPCNTDTDCPSGGFCLVPDIDPDAPTVYKFARFVRSDKVPALLDGICMEGAGGSSAAPTCKHEGTLVSPAKECGKTSSNPDDAFAECYGGKAQLQAHAGRLDKWCDMDIKKCCQHSTNAFCPDGQTPLFNEPGCTNSDPNVANSGTCVGKQGAVCKFAHCCPGATVDSSGQVVKGTDSYETNIPCTPGVRPPGITNGYCDPATGKVIIIGQNAPGGKPFEPSQPGTPKVCQSDTDCSNDQSTICIFDQPTVAHCFKNPKSTTPAASPTPAPPTAPPAQTDPTPDPVQPSDPQTTQDPANVPGDSQGVTTDPSDTSGSTQTGALGASEESDEKKSYIIIIIVVSLLLLLIIILVVGIIVMKKKKGKTTKKGKKGKKNGKNDGKNNKNKKGGKGKAKGKGKGKGKKSPKTEKTTSSSQASSSTARTGSVGGTGTSTGGYSPNIV